MKIPEQRATALEKLKRQNYLQATHEAKCRSFVTGTRMALVYTAQNAGCRHGIQPSTPATNVQPNAPGNYPPALNQQHAQNAGGVGQPTVPTGMPMSAATYQAPNALQVPYYQQPQYAAMPNQALNRGFVEPSGRDVKEYFTMRVLTFLGTIACLVGTVMLIMLYVVWAAYFKWLWKTTTSKHSAVNVSSEAGAFLSSVLPMEKAVAVERANPTLDLESTTDDSVTATNWVERTANREEPRHILLLSRNTTGFTSS